MSDAPAPPPVVDPEVLARLDALAERIERLDRPDTGAHEALLRIEHVLLETVQGVHPRRARGVEQAAQQLLRLRYLDLIAAGRPLPAFADVEARYYSQNGEDGIVQLLLAAVGTGTRRAVELCAGDGVECNAANLVVNHGFDALLVDGGEALLRRGGAFYAHGADTWYAPPTLQQAWVTRDGVDDLVTAAGYAGEVDVLTLDLDGVDFWVWQALTCVRPRVVVAEVNPSLPFASRVTVPYDDTFVWDHATGYFGASLGAMAALGARKGYRLVGTTRYGFNAFFVRDDLARAVLPALAPADLHGTLRRVPGTVPLRTDIGPWVEVD